MTEKERFQANYQGDCLVSVTDKQNHGNINTVQMIDLLNKLNEENKELRKESYGNLDGLNYYQEQNGHLSSKISDLECENEQLKQFQDRVFSWIDMQLQRLPILRDEEFESDNEFADPSLYCGAIEILETMKRELKGDD